MQATEDFMVHLLEDCNLCAIHAKRVTISTCYLCIGDMCYASQIAEIHVCAVPRSAQGSSAGAAHQGPNIRRLLILRLYYTRIGCWQMEPVLWNFEECQSRLY